MNERIYHRKNDKQINKQKNPNMSTADLNIEGKHLTLQSAQIQEVQNDSILSLKKSRPKMSLFFCISAFLVVILPPSSHLFVTAYIFTAFFLYFSLTHAFLLLFFN